jgi:hypothetical protein
MSAKPPPVPPPGCCGCGGAGDTSAAAPDAEPDGDDELERLLDAYSAQAAAEAAAADAARARAASRGRARPAAAARAEALAAPLPAANKGAQLLAKMGYRPGQGLGRGEQVRAAIGAGACFSRGEAPPDRWPRRGPGPGERCACAPLPQHPPYRRTQGRAEPIPLVLRAGRQGLGAEEAAAARKREAEARAAEAGALAGEG